MSNSKLLPISEMAEIAYGKQAKDLPPILTPEIERCTTPEDVFAFARKRNVSVIDFKFTDLLGRWHHFSMPLYHFDESLFKRASALTAPASVPSRRSTNRT